MFKKILAFAVAATLCLSVTGCAKGAKDDKATGDKTIKVGIINNDPNESG
ncbi:MAG TPA: hypothetical protein PKI60_00555 [Oscillospiraceae bacterium]|nr:hypothetical protein [Oscillospiraceae bacterium]